MGTPNIEAQNSRKEQEMSPAHPLDNDPGIIAVTLSLGRGATKFCAVVIFLATEQSSSLYGLDCSYLKQVKYAATP